MTNGEHSVFITGQLGGCDNEIRNLRQALTTVLAQTLHTWPAAGWASPLEFKDNLLRGLSSPAMPIVVAQQLSEKSANDLEAALKASNISRFGFHAWKSVSSCPTTPLFAISILPNVDRCVSSNLQEISSQWWSRNQASILTAMKKADTLDDTVGNPIGRDYNFIDRGFDKGQAQFITAVITAMGMHLGDSRILSVSGQTHQPNCPVIVALRQTEMRAKVLKSRLEAADFEVAIHGPRYASMKYVDDVIAGTQQTLTGTSLLRDNNESGNQVLEQLHLLGENLQGPLGMIVAAASAAGVLNPELQGLLGEEEENRTVPTPKSVIDELPIFLLIEDPPKKKHGKDEKTAALDENDEAVSSLSIMALKERLMEAGISYKTLVDRSEFEEAVRRLPSKKQPPGQPIELPISQCVQNDETPTCVICSETFKVGDTVTKLPKCGHWFHIHHNCPSHSKERDAKVEEVPATSAGARGAVASGSYSCNQCHGKFSRCFGTYGVRNIASGEWRCGASQDRAWLPESPNNQWCSAACENMGVKEQSSAELKSTHTLLPQPPYNIKVKLYNTALDLGGQAFVTTSDSRAISDDPEDRRHFCNTARQIHAKQLDWRVEDTELSLDNDSVVAARGGIPVARSNEGSSSSLTVETPPWAIKILFTNSRTGQKMHATTMTRDPLAVSDSDDDRKKWREQVVREHAKQSGWSRDDVQMEVDESSVKAARGGRPFDEVSKVESTSCLGIIPWLEMHSECPICRCALVDHSLAESASSNISGNDEISWTCIGCGTAHGSDAPDSCSNCSVSRNATRLFELEQARIFDQFAGLVLYLQGRRDPSSPMFTESDIDHKIAELLNSSSLKRLEAMNWSIGSPLFRLVEVIMTASDARQESRAPIDPEWLFVDGEDSNSQALVRGLVRKINKASDSEAASLIQCLSSSTKRTWAEALDSMTMKQLAGEIESILPNGRNPSSKRFMALVEELSRAIVHGARPHIWLKITKETAVFENRGWQISHAVSLLRSGERDVTQLRIGIDAASGKLVEFMGRFIKNIEEQLSLPFKESKYCEHFFTKCDGPNCRMQISAGGFCGRRFKCLMRPNFNLCGDCYSTQADIHDTTHIFREVCGYIENPLASAADDKSTEVPEIAESNEFKGSIDSAEKFEQDDEDSSRVNFELPLLPRCDDEYKEDGLKRQLSIGATLRDILETSAPQTANGALIVLRDIVHQIRKDAQDETSCLLLPSDERLASSIYAHENLQKALRLCLGFEDVAQTNPESGRLEQCLVLKKCVSEHDLSRFQSVLSDFIKSE